MVRVLTGMGAPADFDFSMFNFQVPIELSAPRATIVVSVKPRNVVEKRFRIMDSLFILRNPTWSKNAVIGEVDCWGSGSAVNVMKPHLTSPERP
jgi:hypothetical protein